MQQNAQQSTARRARVLLLSNLSEHNSKLLPVEMMKIQDLPQFQTNFSPSHHYESRAELKNVGEDAKNDP
jgi:hypothetical protein